MIEEILIEYLSKNVGVPVYLEEKNLDEYLLVGKTGSSRENYINSCIVFVQSYAKTNYAAALLNEKVKKAMDEIVSLDSISSSKLNSDYNFTDTTKEKYRYQAVYDLVFYM